MPYADAVRRVRVQDRVVAGVVVGVLAVLLLVVGWVVWR
jgi:hypothetical protein